MAPATLTTNAGGIDQRRSLWRATAPLAPATAPLEGRVDAEVVVVGAGYTGLSCALALAEAGRSVILLEAGDIGHGASGRNGGQVIPGLKHDPDDLVARFGSERGETLVRHTRPRQRKRSSPGPGNGPRAARRSNCSGATASERCSVPTPTARVGSTAGPARCIRWRTHAGSPLRR